MTTVEVADLRVCLTGTETEIVSGVSFEIRAGEVMGLVGESGSGKSTVAMALLNFAKRGASVTGGSVHVDGQDILTMKGADLRRARGNLVAYVPQDPSVSLNPVMQVGEQLREVLPRTPKPEVGRRITELLDEVGLPGTPDFLRKYPHEMSGGQQQRVVIAMSVLARPRLLVLDEPTTALDVSTQARVLTMVAQLCQDHDMAAVYVSHDLGVVSEVADQIVVLYSGRVVERGRREQIFAAPRHPYTIGLLASMPSTTERRRLLGIPGRAPSPLVRPGGCAFAPRCDFAVASCSAEEPDLVEGGSGHHVRCSRLAQVAVDQPRAQGLVLAPSEARPPETSPLLRIRSFSASYGDRTVLTDIDLEVGEGECLALVGESGSGKSTLARSLVGLHRHWTGSVTLDGVQLPASAAQRDVTVRRRLQYVFQNPYSSLNPRRTVADSVAVPLDLFVGERGEGARHHVLAALERVGLSSSLADRYPNELSGGERQRAAIARAIVCRPDVLLCDEITSALDVSVQATVIELLRDLMADGLTMVFVTHDLAVVRSIADRVAVLDQGRIIEAAQAEAVFGDPQTDYTRELLASTPGAPTPV